MIRVSLPNCRNAEKSALTVVLTANHHESFATNSKLK